jgi:hypothetical protein
LVDSFCVGRGGGNDEPSDLHRLYRETTKMDKTLFEQFGSVLQSISPVDLADAIEGAERAFNKALRDHDMSDLFPRPVETRQPCDRLLQVFEGRTLGEVATVWTQLRNELGDELARRGAEADIVSDLREGGPRV